MNMSQTLAFKKSSMVECSTPILCCYVNVTNNLQIIRITNIPNLHLERVVFPGERLMFEAVPEAKLEIHTNEMVTALVADTITCQQLSVTE